MIGRLSKTLVACALALIVASCDTHTVDGELRDLSVRYAPPSLEAEDGSLFKIGSNYRTSFNTSLNRLRGAGFKIISADAATGEIRAESNANNLITCGRLSVGERGSPNIFPANAELAVIEVPAGPGRSSFLRRQVAVHTTVDIRLGVVSGRNDAVFASIGESHVVNISLAQVTDGQEVYDQTVQFSGGEIRRFRRGIECGSSGEVRAIILGN